VAGDTVLILSAVSPPDRALSSEAARFLISLRDRDAPRPSIVPGRRPSRRPAR
jgi:hypothetical protein